MVFIYGRLYQQNQPKKMTRLRRTQSLAVALQRVQETELGLELELMEYKMRQKKLRKGPQPKMLEKTS